METPKGKRVRTLMNQSAIQRRRARETFCRGECFFLGEGGSGGGNGKKTPLHSVGILVGL